MLNVTLTIFFDIRRFYEISVFEISSVDCICSRQKLYDGQSSGLPQSGKNIRKVNFFQVREKSGNFVDDQGNLERTWKVREKSGNLKINGYGRQSSENLFILFKRGKDVLC